MTRPYPGDAEDLTAVAASDRMLDALAAGRPAPAETDAVADLLTAWRVELDDHAQTAMSAAPTAARQPQRRWRDTHRRTAAVAAIVVAVAGSTGVAAAAGGNSGPLSGLHRLFFGHSAKPHVDKLALSAKQLLNHAETQIAAAVDAGTVSPARRDRIATELDQASALLARDALAPQPLLARLDRLTSTLAAIPGGAPVAPPVTDNHGSGGHGRDDIGTDDRSGSGRDGDDGNTSGSDSHDSGSGGGSGSGDDGNTSGSGSHGGGSGSSGDGGGDGGSGSSGDSGSSDTSDSSGSSGG